MSSKRSMAPKSFEQVRGPDFQLRPLIFASVKDRLKSKTNSYEMRQQLPVKFVGTIERVLPDRRFVLSLADSNVSLMQLQGELRDGFKQLEDAGNAERVEQIKIGSYYLLKEQSGDIFRVRALESNGDMVSVYLVDFGQFTMVGQRSLYTFGSDFFDKYEHPYVARVILPPDEVLRSLNLPTSQMFQPGDVVDVVVFSTQEPHLAVFGLARSITRRILPTGFVDGFDEMEAKNWSDLFTKAASNSKPTILKQSYGRLSNRDQHANRLALIVFAKSLDKVYVRDLDSAIRMTFVRERLSSIYSAAREQFVIKSTSELHVGAGCVALHPDRNVYLRVEVVALGKECIHVAPVDELTFGSFTVSKEQVFKIPEALSFPRQYFSVQMAAHSEGQRRFYFSSLARCVIPDGTPIILDTDSEFGLVKIKCANTKDVLKKIGFHLLGESVAEPHSHYVSQGFGHKKELVTRPDKISDFVTSIEEPKKKVVQEKKAMKSALKK